jgi:hypothetical protein
MIEDALSFEDAWAAGLHYHLQTCAEGVCLEIGRIDEVGCDIETFMYWVCLALESGRAVRVEGFV